MWHKSREPPCLFTQAVDTCYYIPTTCLYLTSRRICVDNQYHSARLTAKSWERDHNDKRKICQQYPSTNIYQKTSRGNSKTTTHLAASTIHSYWCTCQTRGTTINPNTTCWCCTAPLCAEYHVTGTFLFYIPPRLHLVILHPTKTAPCYFTSHQDCTLLLYIPPRLRLVTLHSTKTPCYFTFHQDCTLLLYIPPRLHIVTLHPTRAAPCYFTFHQDCTLLLYIPPRLHLVTLHTTKSVLCYFTFHQDCTLLLYIPRRLHLVILHSTKNEYFLKFYYQSALNTKPVASESACLTARVHHIVTTGVGNYTNATHCTCVMFTPISIIKWFKRRNVATR